MTQNINIKYKDETESKGSSLPELNVIGTIISGAVTLTALVGVTSGIATRMLRNDELWTTIFFAMVMIGSLLPLGAVVLGQLVKGVGSYVASVFFLSVLLVAIGLFGLVKIASASSVVKEAPQLSFSTETLSSGLVKISATIKADGLLVSDRVFLLAKGALRVNVHPLSGLRLKPDDFKIDESRSGAVNKVGSATLVEAFFGPSAAGSVEATYTFEVSPTLYNNVAVYASWQAGDIPIDVKCPQVSKLSLPDEDPPPDDGGAARDPKSSCVLLPLSLPPIRPVLTASWVPGTTTDLSTLEVNLSTAGVPQSRLVVLRAWKAGQSVPILDYALSPDMGGNVKASVKIPMQIGTKPLEPAICVVAALVPSGTTGKPEAPSGTTGKPQNPSNENCASSTDLGETVARALIGTWP